MVWREQCLRCLFAVLLHSLVVLIAMSSINFVLKLSINSFTIAGLTLCYLV